MIQTLLDYGRQQGLASTPGYGTEKARWILDFTESGDKFIGLAAASPDAQGTKTFRDIPRLSAEEKKGKFLAGRAADFLLAPLGEIFGVDDKGNDDAGKARRAAFFRECLTEAGEYMPGLLEVARELEDPATLVRVKEQAASTKLKWTDKATLRLGPRFPLESNTWKPWWEEFRLKLSPPAKTDGATMVSFATGELVVPESVHEKFRGWTAIGGSSFGEPLIAFDKEAFSSYGLEQGKNAAMEATAVSGYAGALRHLAEHNVLLAGSYFLSWYTGPNELVQAVNEEDDDPFAIFNFETAKGETEIDPHMANARLRAAVKRIKTANGAEDDLSDLRFCVLNLSVAPGRVMIRDHIEGSFLSLNEAAKQWFSDLEIVDARGATAPLPSLARLIEAPLPPRSPDTDSKKWSAPAVAWARPVWRSALRVTPLPQNAFARTLDAHRRTVIAEGLHQAVTQKGDLTAIARLTARRMALLKAYLLRKEIPMTPGLDPENPHPAYHCGRLIALYDGLQRAALGDVGAGVVQRFYAGATTNPALVFARLAKLAVVHLDKLEGGLANWYESQIATAHDGIKGEYPGVLSPNDQALFALGFWHQIAERNRRIAEGRAKKDAAASSLTAENL
ncbi:hypothetical protein EON81_07980 [bacterium]|nr:MAG: hypothetical protein EON81_07980 [bacterium]